MEKYEGRYVEYLGDGAYALYDDFGVTLRANDHRDPSKEVYLDNHAIEVLNQFIAVCRKENQDGNLDEICGNCGYTKGFHYGGNYYSKFYNMFIPRDYCPGNDMSWDKGPGTVFKNTGKIKEAHNATT